MLRVKELIQYDNGGLIQNPSKVQSIINKYSGGRSPLTAKDYIEVSNRTKVPIELLLAQSILESNIGTKGMAVRTQNVGNVGNNGNTGKTTNHGGWRRGLDNMANLLKNDYHAQSEADIQRLINTNFLRPVKGGRYAEESDYGQNVAKLIKNISNINVNYSEKSPDIYSSEEYNSPPPDMSGYMEKLSKGMDGEWYKNLPQNTRNIYQSTLPTPDVHSIMLENARMESERIEQEAIKRSVEQENLQIQEALKIKEMERQNIISMIPQAQSIRSSGGQIKIPNI